MNEPVRISPHFTLAEATKTSQPFSNMPDRDEDMAAIHRTAIYMESIRELLGGVPVIITSWYRNDRVNRAVGGVPNSQHRLGEAVDFVAPRYGTPAEVCQAIAASFLPYDQLILEPSWVHVSFLTNRLGVRPSARKQLLTYDGKRYHQGILA